jgi:hypothetical protein
MRLRACIILWAPILLGACAIGNKHAYHSVVASVPVEGAGQVSVATHDQRPYVLSDKKTPEFVGLSRGGYGNPFDVTTENGRPLAENMTQAIATSLSQKGFESIPVAVTASEGVAVAREKLAQAGADRAVLLTLREWKSDTYMSTTIAYDVTLTILDRSGRVVGESRLMGEDNLGKDVVNPPAHAKKVVPEAFKAKLEQLLSDPAIVTALRGSPGRGRGPLRCDS